MRLAARPQPSHRLPERRSRIAHGFALFIVPGHFHGALVLVRRSSNTSLTGELQDRDRMLKVRRQGRNRAPGAHFSSAQGAVRHRTFSSDSITISTRCEPPSGCAGQRAVVGGTSGSNLMAPL